MTEQTAAPMGDTGANAPDGANASTGQTSTQSGSWYSSYDTDTVGWLENRGLTKLEPTAALPEVIKGFRNAEKYIGTPAEQLIRVPKADAPNDAWNDVYNKLGRPSDAKEYQLPIPDGADPAFADWAKGQFHELGLTKTQGEKLASKWNEYVGSIGEQQTAQYQNSVAEDTNSLKAEWGQAFDQNIKVARQAANSFGVDVATIDKLEQAMGFAGVMKFFNNLGSKIGEDSFVSGDSNSSNVMTPKGAEARIKALMSDPDFSTKYLSGQVEAREEMSRLHKMAYNS